MQDELTSLQNERSELLDDTLQLQSAVSKLTNEKRKLLQELDWLSKRSSGYEAVARTLKEQNEVLNGTVCVYAVRVEHTSHRLMSHDLNTFNNLIGGKVSVSKISFDEVLNGTVCVCAVRQQMCCSAIFA